MKSKVNINGRGFDVCSQVDAEDACYYICSDKSAFEDDIHTSCDLCGREIVHRPHAPLMPKKICTQCAIKEVLKEQDRGGLVDWKISESTVHDLKNVGLL